MGSLLRQKQSSALQFIKYVLCGGISVAVDQLAFYLLGWLVWPCLRVSDPVAKLLSWAGATLHEVSESELHRNYWFTKSACFLASNAVVYLLNVWFVFESGRHHRSLEILLFFGFSLVQFLYIALGAVLIDRCGWEVTYANVTILILGIITNYFARKKIVFRR